jgi:hypothetical protein
MKNKLLGLAFASVLFSSPVLAAPVYRVDAEVAQGNVGNGLSVVLAPAQVVSINFSKMGEKIASITPGDRSRFVFNVSGSVVILKRIKPLNFEGEYSGGGDTTLIITTVGASGQKVYPVTVRFSDRRAGYSVVEISPDGGMEPIPARVPQRDKIPLTTVQAPYRPTVPAEVAILPIDDPVKVLASRPETLPPPPVVVESPKLEPKSQPQTIAKEEPKPDPKVEPVPKRKTVISPPQESAKAEPKPEIKEERSPKVEVAIAAPQESVKEERSPKVEVAIAASQESAKLEPDTPQKKLTNHQQANAIVLGMMRSKVRYSEFRRVQDAIWFLRKGKSLTVAATRSGASVSRLKQFIELGSRKNA